MKGSFKRIMTILQKDIKEYWILVLIFIVIPIVIFYMPALKNVDKVKICVVSNSNINDKLNFDNANISYSNTVSDGLEQLNEKKIDAVVSVEEKIIYCNTKDINLISTIKKGLTASNPTQVKVEILNNEPNEDKFSFLLCVIIVIMVGLIGSPIVFLSENKNDSLSSLMLSSLTYFEFTISKTIFGFLCTASTLITFLLITQELNNNTFAILSMIFITSFFISIFSGLISLPFRKIEQMMLITSPIMVILVLLELLSLNSNFNKYLPIQKGFREVLVKNIFPTEQILIIGGTSIVLLLIYMFLLRQFSRIQR
ncbi:ABC transporter permease [Clostridium sp. BJN0013]|uniref:ABC transporter permease n=1 Tax=Clostridium sp. BJN0013 TaxID=3236840 RepID=UPI0034C6548E